MDPTERSNGLNLFRTENKNDNSLERISCDPQHLNVASWEIPSFGGVPMGECERKSTPGASVNFASVKIFSLAPECSQHCHTVLKSPIGSDHPFCGESSHIHPTKKNATSSSNPKFTPTSNKSHFPYIFHRKQHCLLGLAPYFSRGTGPSAPLWQ